MANRYADWFRQAEADLRHARHAHEDGDFEWSCFATHQAAEKALKAVFLKSGMDAWGHNTLTVLIGNLPDHIKKPSDTLANSARVLDKFYIPTRYPNGFESGAPTDFYTADEAQNAISLAEAILEFSHLQIN
jgi:HEPN domain-containing protein